jgi:hypothetical protein
MLMLSCKASDRPYALLRLQLLVVQLALQLLRFCHLAHGLVEVVLVDRVSVVLDSE